MDLKPYKIEASSEKKRNENYPFAEMWKFLSQSKEDAVITINDFNWYTAEECIAIENATKYTTIGHKAAYENNRENSKPNPDLLEYFGKLDEIDSHGYDEYLRKYIEIKERYEGQIKNIPENLSDYDKNKRRNILIEKQNTEIKDWCKDNKPQGSNKTFSEIITERDNKKAELYTKFAAAHKGKNLIDTNALRSLNGLPDKVIKNVLEFAKDCKEKGISDEILDKNINEMLSHIYACPTEEIDGEKIKNEHRFKVDKDGKSVSHSILNINGSGLALTLTNEGYSILFCDDKITKKQVDALAGYCLMNGINITNFGDVASRQVQDTVEGEDIGELQDVYDKSIKEIKEKNRKTQNQEQTQPQSQNQEDKDTNADNEAPTKQENQTQPQSQEVTCTNVDNEAPVNDDGNYFGEYLAKLNKPTTSFNADLNGLCAKNAGTRVYDISEGINESIVRFYASEEDQEDDRRIDKNGKLQKKKLLAITFKHNKGEAEFYLGGKTKLEAGDIRIALDAFKKQGYKYFEYPAITDRRGFGAGTQEAFFKASVKSGMPLLLKGPSGRGCDIGPADIDTILKFTNEPENFSGKPLEKAEYLMRWHEQLVKYTTSQGKSEFGKVMDKVKFQAIFTNQASYEDKINEVISNFQKDGIQYDTETEKRKWDKLDDICADIALNKLLTDIKEGKVKVNPLDPKNSERIAETFKSYLLKNESVDDKGNKKNIRLSLENNIDENTRGKRGDPTQIFNNAVQNIAKIRKNDLDRTIRTYESDTGVKIQWELKRSDYDYKPKSNTNTKTNTYTVPSAGKYHRER